MILRKSASTQRRGLSLLEVIVALAIFLFSMIVISRLVTFGSERALEVQYRGQAALLCQSKMAEVVAGAVGLSPQTDAPFDEDPDWLWSVECEQQGNIPGLWTVTVRVTRARQDRTRGEASLSQMVLDPSMRGSTMDAAAATTSATDAAATAATSGSTTGTTSTQGSTGSATGGSTSSQSSGGGGSSQPASSAPATGSSSSSKGGRP